MKSRTVTVSLALIAGLAIVIVLALAWRAQAAWNSQDYRADASGLVQRELRMSQTGVRPVLTTKLYGSNANSRDLCVYELGADGHAVNIWSVMYTHGLFRTVTHEQYTPHWRPAHSGGIVRDLCLHSAAEPPPAGTA